MTTETGEFILYYLDGSIVVIDKNNPPMVSETVWNQELNEGAGANEVIETPMTVNPYRVAKEKGSQKELDFKSRLEAIEFALGKFEESYLDVIREEYFTDIIYRKGA